MKGFLKVSFYIVLLLGAAGGFLMAMGGKEGRVSATVQGTLRCLPDEAMTWIGLPGARRKWVLGMKEYREVTPLELEAGARARVTMLTEDSEEYEITVEVTQVVQDKLIVMRVTGDNWEETSRYELTPKGGHTYLTHELTREYTGFFRKLIAPLRGHWIKERMLEDLDRLQDSATFAFS
jgi:uncharacterized protein YndB with AHSA1/START domain